MAPNTVGVTTPIGPTVGITPEGGTSLSGAQRLLRFFFLSTAAEREKSPSKEDDSSSCWRLDGSVKNIEEK